ncbi:antitoxin MazE-like protein [Pleomorphomonas carboxyditropha]|uniref:DUF3018 domain-containing protein n=1 Tax=Pleomorphomonas carboxyditropha TaxID=2023338 RepID=A0A2G9WS31_9HYPH|nr:antitoxin MazE-like protein [Pleomorphomonas carboxyditropha]PIO97455.1 hypothetical protein CJ014_20740 [Pleomorphomonas carboxyditropha]
MSRSKQNNDGQPRRGMRQLRLWMTDPNRPEFVTEARRQGLSLRGRPEEAEALAFIAAAVEWLDRRC